MAKMTGGEAVVRSLIAEGVEVVFGIPASHSLTIYEALYHHPEIRHITARHEQGAGHMADGYSRASGKPGVCITSAGPGACNSVTAMAEAYSASAPVINITTQNEPRLLGREKGARHDTKDQLGMFRTVTGWNTRVESIKDVAPAIHEAFRRIRTQRPRPIELEFTASVLQASDDIEIRATESHERAAGNPAKVARAVDYLAKSRKPVIWAGGGVLNSRASGELVRLAELLQAPVLTSAAGKTVMPSDHPLCLGRLVSGWGGGAGKSPIVRLLEESDLMLAIGTRLGESDTRGWAIPIPDQLIQIDIDEAQFGKNYPYRIGIAGDARAILDQLQRQLEPVSKRPSRSAEISTIKEAVYQRAKLRAPEEMQMVEDIRAVAGPKAILSLDVTTARYWAGIFSRVFEPRTEMGSFGFNGLGFALPAGIGAKVACPDRPVIVLAGDGGFQFSGMELATAMQFGANVVVIIFDDKGFGEIRDRQKHLFDGHYIGVSLRNPDFVKFAEAYGAAATAVASLSGIKSALEKALSSATTTVIVAPGSVASVIGDTERSSATPARS